MTLKRKKDSKQEQDFKFHNELVIQHNALVESRYRLSLQEKRLIIFLISEINKKDNELNIVKTDVRELSQLIGVGASHLYRDMARVTKSLISRVLSIRNLDEDSLLQVSWISSAKYDFKKGKITLRISDELAPYLLKLQNNFTVLRTSDLMKFKSIYSVRIFELLSQYKLIGERYFDLESLKLSCGVPAGRHKKISDFRTYVLDISKKEINDRTDMEIDYTEIKESRKIVGILFSIKNKTHFEKDQAEKSSLVEKELRSANALTEGIMELGFSRVAAKRFLQRDSEETVRNALKSVNLQIERGHVKNAKAMFVVAVNEKWNPEIFVAKKPKKAKE